MKLFLYHFFYRMYWWNTQIVKEKNFPVFSALLGVSVFTMLNITTIIFAYLVFVLKNPLAYPKWLHIIVSAFALVLNYFIYVHKKKYLSILKTMSEVAKSKIRVRDALSTLYILLSFSMVVWIVICSRNALGIK
ncbi:hypothetical protein HYN49_06175 [Flavobacterium pallidum]|uniref:Uncharacterized protein n=1 Tax=Flavobacterium pallidum TaxID=2172098 RepID=A0A2S1SGK6_9FLAO|nr:hypothetical protein HYN49_06175 [Flavobacterium pallidum]